MFNHLNKHMFLYNHSNKHMFVLIYIYSEYLAKENIEYFWRYVSDVSLLKPEEMENGENFMLLNLQIYLLEYQKDCIYQEI